MKNLFILVIEHCLRGNEDSGYRVWDLNNHENAKFIRDRGDMFTVLFKGTEEETNKIADTLQSNYFEKEVNQDYFYQYQNQYSLVTKKERIYLDSVPEELVEAV